MRKIMLDKKETVTLSIDSMSCLHCTRRVEDALTALHGVYGAKADLEKQTAVVRYSPSKVTADDMINAVIAAGFGAKVL